MKTKVFLSAFALTCVSVSAQLQYPTTKKEPVTDTYFGIPYTDSYRWLENLKEIEVSDWFKMQAYLTDATLSKIKGRALLLDEWRTLDKLQPPSYNSFTKEGNYIFFKKSLPGEKVSKVYYKEGMDGAEQLLFDPLTFIAGKTLSVHDIMPSYDGKLLAIAYTEKGAEVSTIRFMEVATKQFLPDVITNATSLESWTFDNNSIMYMWIKSADNTDPTSRLNPKTKLHVLGTDPEKDADFFSNERYPDLHIEAKDYPYAFVNEDAPDYVIGKRVTVARELQYYYAPVSEIASPNIPWKVLSTPEDKLVRSFSMVGDEVYAITYKGAKNYKLVKANLKNLNWATATVIAPEKPNQTLERFTRCKDYLLLTYSDGISHQLYKYNITTKITTPVILPFKGMVSVSCMDTQNNNCTVGITSWNKPFTEFLMDAATDTFSPSPFNQPPSYPAAYTNLVVEEVTVKGHDGVMIPMTLVYQKGLQKNGKHICLMDSYGAYGVSMTPSFSVRKNSLAVRGVVLAYPHVRGGSEKGQDWYKAGFKKTKPNTWKDFISCAEYLIKNGYTNAKQLAGTGTSAGGILISRAITERPDLFAAAICNVGCANAMRGEFTSNGPANIPEFGTVTNEEECKALFEMDGMLHVKDGVKYPAVLGVAGWNDPRVVAWQPGKFVAAVQNASASTRPVLLKVNYDNGHFTEDKEVTFANFADQYSFVLWQCGHPDFKVVP